MLNAVYQQMFKKSLIGKSTSWIYSVSLGKKKKKKLRIYIFRGRRIVTSISRKDKSSLWGCSVLGGNSRQQSQRHPRNQISWKPSSSCHAELTEKSPLSCYVTRVLLQPLDGVRPRTLCFIMSPCEPHKVRLIDGIERHRRGGQVTKLTLPRCRLGVRLVRRTTAPAVFAGSGSRYPEGHLARGWPLSSFNQGDCELFPVQGHRVDICGSVSHTVSVATGSSCCDMREGAGLDSITALLWTPKFESMFFSLVPTWSFHFSLPVV